MRLGPAEAGQQVNLRARAGVQKEQAVDAERSLVALVALVVVVAAEDVEVGLDAEAPHGLEPEARAAARETRVAAGSAPDHGAFAVDVEAPLVWRHERALRP